MVRSSGRYEAYHSRLLKPVAIPLRDAAERRDDVRAVLRVQGLEVHDVLMVLHGVSDALLSAVEAEKAIPFMTASLRERRLY